MQISCGQFSYASVAPTAILGVSGALEIMGDYERSVFRRYGVERLMYLPSVYGDSQFMFDKAGEGVLIEKDISNYFHKITEVLIGVTRNERAAIIFLRDMRLKQFVSSSFYRKLGRNKSILKEDMSAAEKGFVIGKAATAGQITICSSVFGRGTDFFCKDETVEKKGGVHVVQTFLSAEESEEIQIQGRTARQGKKGTYSMILLEHDLEVEFGISC